MSTKLTKSQEALRELMEKYNESRSKWIEFYGSDEGFNDWFTNQLFEERAQ